MNATAVYTFHFKQKGLKLLQHFHFVSVSPKETLLKIRKQFLLETTLKTTSTLITETPSKECFTNPQVQILPVISIQHSRSHACNTNFNVLSANVCFCCLTTFYHLQKLPPSAFTSTFYTVKMRDKCQFYCSTSQSKTLTCPSAT